MIAEGHQTIGFSQVLQYNVRLAARSEGERFQWRRAVLINRRVGFFRGVELINDIDGLRSHAHLGHERIERDDLFLLQTRLRDEVVKLHPEHDLAFYSFMSQMGMA